MAVRYFSKIKMKNEDICNVILTERTTEPAAPDFCGVGCSNEKARIAGVLLERWGGYTRGGVPASTRT